MSDESCPMCGGDGYALGALGNTWHLRCRDCGWQYAVTEEDCDLYDDEVAP